MSRGREKEVPSFDAKVAKGALRCAKGEAEIMRVRLARHLRSEESL